jgi:hypothetical protein
MSYSYSYILRFNSLKINRNILSGWTNCLNCILLNVKMKTHWIFLFWLNKKINCSFNIKLANVVVKNKIDFVVYRRCKEKEKTINSHNSKIRNFVLALSIGCS